ncbi:hypothetical protein AAVH_25061 [Aphelenchoides avenae]|nr:hypothetical protein AAVH_25061 [Aphelenchus avenae]
MLHEIALEAVRYFDRPTLEGLQMHSRYLRDMVNRHASTLPLRYIHDVWIIREKAYIQLMEDEYGEDEEDDWLPAVHEQDIEALFRRVNNAFIHQLTLNFCREDLRLAQYLRENVGNLQCQLRVLRTRSTSDAIDYDLVDFLGAYFKPPVYATYMHGEVREEYAMLFTCNALRSSVTHVVYHVS